MKLTELAIRRPVAVIVLIVATAVIGWFSLARIDVDYLPDITYPMVKIHIWWRGATPEEIDKQIADPLERAMATVDNLDYLDSSAIEGMYTLLVNFRYGVNVDVAYQDVMAIMGRVARKLPTDIDPPVVIKADPSQLPVMEVTLASERRSLTWLREWAENWLVERLSAVPGTAGAEVVGGVEREIRVHLDPIRMAAYGLTPEKIVAVLREENRETFAGRITVDHREIIARTMGEFKNLEEIRNVVVARGRSSEIVYLKDIATIEDSHEELRVNTRFNGKPCVKVNVLKQAEANTVKVAAAVKARLESLRDEIPPDIRFGVVENQGDYVIAAIKSVRDSAILAAILVVLVIYLFLGHWRQIAVMITALPLTLLANFFVMKIAGFSLNIFSLGGLVVALGVLLNNSIVVLENITRLKHEREVSNERMGEDVVIIGTREVGPAVIAATASFLALFLPFLFVPGLASLLFYELVLVIASVVLISMLVAITITPFLAKHWIKLESIDRLASATMRFFERVTEVYGVALKAVLHLRWLTVLLSIATVIGAIYSVRLVGSEFFPKLDDGRIMVKLRMPAGSAVGETDRILARIEEQVSGFPEVESVFSMAGGRVWGLATYEIANEGEVDIQLVPKNQRTISTAGFIEKIRPLVKKVTLPGAKLAVRNMPIKGIRKIGVQDVEVKVQGAEIQPIYDFAMALAAKMNEIPQLANVNISMDMTKPEYRVYIDRARASALGISANKVASTLRTLVHGTVATEYREGSEYYDIRVMVPEPRITNKIDLENLILETRNGKPIYIRDVATVQRAVGPVEIAREDQVKEVIVRADPAAGVSVGEAVARARAVAESLQKPPGVSFAMGGQAQLMAENRWTLGMILSFASFFAFAVLAIQFESFRLPIIIFLSLPVCLAGMIYGLLVGGGAIGVTVAIGVFVVIASTVNDGVLLLDFAEELRKTQGYSTFDAVLTAAKIRFRPRVMTTIGAVAGFVPLALNLGEGGDLLQPMAVASIGGLLMEVAVALFLIPVLYLFFCTKFRDDFSNERSLLL